MAVLILAEIGSNHVGNLTLAKDLIASAAQCGADGVKFQAFDSTIWTSPEEWEKRRPFAIDPPFAQECASFAGALGLEFICTPCYPEAVSWLNPLVKRWKVASADLHNEDLVNAILATGKQVLYSIGVHRSLLPTLGVGGWIPMVCVSRYPARVDEYALAFCDDWGLSDHTTSLHLAVAAVARGASVVEKHLKLEEQPWSPDRDHSIPPSKFKEFVKGIREIEKVLANLECAPPRFAPGRKVF